MGVDRSPSGNTAIEIHRNISVAGRRLAFGNRDRFLQ